MSSVGDPRIEARLVRALHAGARTLGLITDEDERALIVAEAVAERLGLPLRSWSAAAGVDGSGRERDLAGLLLRLHGHGASGPDESDDALWLLVEAAAELRGPTQRRMLRELAQARVGPRLILVETDPAALASVPELELVALPRPDPELLRERMVAHAHASTATRPQLAASVIEVADVLAAAARGLSLRRVDRVLAEALADPSATAASVRATLERHRLADASAGVLEQVIDDGAPLLGYTRWLAWLRARAWTGARVPARAVGLLAPPGCGLARAVRAGAAALDLPLVRPGLSLGAVPDTVEAQLRALITALERAAPVMVWLEPSLPDALARPLARWLAAADRGLVAVVTAHAPPLPWPELAELDVVFFADLPDAELRAELLARALGPGPAWAALADPSEAWLACARAAEGRSHAELLGAVDEARRVALAAARPATAADLEAALALRPPLAVREAERLASVRAWAELHARPA